MRTNNCKKKNKHTKRARERDGETAVRTIAENKELHKSKRDQEREKKQQNAHRIALRKKLKV